MIMMELDAIERLNIKFGKKTRKCFNFRKISVTGSQVLAG